MKVIVKLLPAIILMALVITGTDILMAACIAFFCATLLCMTFKKKTASEVIKIGIENANGGMQVAFIIMMAYAMAEIYMATGVGASAISLFLHLGVTGQSIAVISFLATCVLSVSTGTSWGTFAACIPIFIWLSNVVGGNPGMVMAACMGGSAFGDNLGLISDTTILSSGLADVKVVDRVRSQLPWSLICVALTAILTMVQDGFAGAGSWAIILTFWAMGFCGIMKEMDAFQPIADFFVRISRKVRHLVTCNGLLCLLMNLTLTDEIAQMVTAGPVTRDIINDNVEGSEEKKYELRLRSALFSDAVGVHTATLIPWHTGVAYYVGITLAVYPIYQYHFTDLYFNFMGIITVVSIYVLTFTGLDRFIPWFKQPREPEVRLKKKQSKSITSEA